MPGGWRRGRLRPALSGAGFSEVWTEDGYAKGTAMERMLLARR